MVKGICIFPTTFHLLNQHKTDSEQIIYIYIW